MIISYHQSHKRLLQLLAKVAALEKSLILMIPIFHFREFFKSIIYKIVSTCAKFISPGIICVFLAKKITPKYSKYILSYESFNFKKETYKSNPRAKLISFPINYRSAPTRFD